MQLCLVNVPLYYKRNLEEAHNVELPVSVSRGIAASEYAYNEVN